MRRVRAICKRCKDEAKKLLTKPVIPDNETAGFTVEELCRLATKITIAEICLKCSKRRIDIPEGCPYIVELAIHQSRR